MAIRIDRSLIGTNMEDNFVTNLLRSEKLKAKDVCGNVTLYNADYVTTETDVSLIRSVVCETDELKNCTNVFVGLPFPIEIYETSDVEFDVSKCLIMPSYEGTLIRVFFADGKWFTSTNRKLDANKSKWASKHETFGQRFRKAILENADELLESAFERLGRDKQHMFFLRASLEERIVCDAPETPTVLFIGSFDPVEPHLSSMNDVCPLDLKRNERLCFSSFSDVLNHVADSDCRQTQGVIVFDLEENKIYKILSKRYQHLSSIRAGVPSLRFRYMMLRSSGGMDMFEFLQLYPQMNAERKVIEEQIWQAAKRLQQLYYRIHIEGDTKLELKPEEHVALNKIHFEYRKTRITTTAHRINDILADGNPSVINKLLKVYEKLD